MSGPPRHLPQRRRRLPGPVGLGMILDRPYRPEHGTAHAPLPLFPQDAWRSVSRRRRLRPPLACVPPISDRRCRCCTAAGQPAMPRQVSVTGRRNMTHRRAGQTGREKRSRPIIRTKAGGFAGKHAQALTPRANNRLGIRPDDGRSHPRMTPGAHPPHDTPRSRLATPGAHTSRHPTPTSGRSPICAPISTHVDQGLLCRAVRKSGHTKIKPRRYVHDRRGNA
jgi:hypothetical protein